MARELRTGAVLCEGRFEVRALLGEGGTGLVHEAYDRERGHLVALKGLSNMSPAGIYQLKNEFRSLADVVHPNLVRLYELFADGGLWLFSMELVPGKPFDQWARPGGRLDEGRLRDALAQLVRAVRAIHTADKLHRDLKPGNVLVQDDGRVVILDFGLMTDPEQGGVGQTLEGGNLCGTPAYMAPEQAAGQAATRATDWYQVGVMLFEALTGALPFGGEIMDIIVGKAEAPAPLASSLVYGLPEDLDELCSALLQREPQARPDGVRMAARLHIADGDTPDTSMLPRMATQVMGRDAELSRLRAAYDRADAGQLTVVRVTGESGIGKSGLVAWFLSELTRAGRAMVLSGSCYEGESVPYKAFDRLVDNLSRYLRTQGDLELATLLPRDTSALARLFPVLDRIEVIASAPVRRSSGEQELRRRAFVAFADLLGRLCDRRPVVLHVDDMQWTDEESLLLFEFLCAQTEPAPILLILGHRPIEPVPPLSVARIDAALAGVADAELVEIDLQPLAGADARRLATSLLPEGPHRAELAAAVAHESGGSPFFIGELCRYLAPSSRPDEAPDVSLDQAIMGRVANLNGNARQLLELLAISGQPVPAAVVAAAAAGDPDPHHQLDLLRVGQFVRVGSGRDYECYHDRTRRVVVASMSRQTRQDAHLRLARAWLAREDAESEVLYEHYLAAGQTAAAAEHAVTGAARANRNLAFERGAALYRKAIALWGDADETAPHLHERLAESLSMAGRWGEAGEAFARASSIADKHRRKTYLLHQAAQHYLATGRRDEGMPLLRQLFASFNVPWPRTRIGALAYAAWQLLWLRLSGAPARLRGADAPVRFDGLGGTAEHLYPESPGRAPPEMLYVNSLLGGVALISPYDLARGAYYTTAFIRRALRTGEPSYVSLALALLASVMSTFRPTLDFAQVLATRAVSIARQRAAPDLASVSLGLAAFARLCDGKLDEAIELSSEGVELLGEQNRSAIYQSWTTRSVRSYALSLAGRVGEAGRYSEDIARDARELGDELAALGGESTLPHLLRDDPVAAERLLDHKDQVLTRFESGTLFHHAAAVERVCCALYQGKGGEALGLVPTGNVAGLLPFGVNALKASCVLQAIAAGGSRARYMSVLQNLRKRVAKDPQSGAAALGAHLDGAMCLLEDDRPGAQAHLERAARAYADVGMQLHAALMDWRRAALLDGDEGKRLSAEAERFMVAQGIVSPHGWAQMLASGLEG